MPYFGKYRGSEKDRCLIFLDFHTISIRTESTIFSLWLMQFTSKLQTISQFMVSSSFLGPPRISRSPQNFRSPHEIFFPRSPQNFLWKYKYWKWGFSDSMYHFDTKVYELDLRYNYDKPHGWWQWINKDLSFKQCNKLTKFVQ